MKELKELTRAEDQVMQILWKLEKGFVKDIIEHMPDPKPDYGVLLDMIGDKNLSVPMEPNSLRFAGDLMVDFYRHADKQGLGKYFPMEEGPVIEDDHAGPIGGTPTFSVCERTRAILVGTSNSVPRMASSPSAGRVCRAKRSVIPAT